MKEFSLLDKRELFFARILLVLLQIMTGFYNILHITDGEASLALPYCCSAQKFLS